MLDIQLDFSDLEPIEKEFTYKGETYILTEAPASSVCRFNNERSSRIEFNDQGKVQRVKNIADLVFILLEGCVLKQSDRSTVPVKTLQSWPGRLVEKLFESVKLISGVDEGVTRQFRSLSLLLDEKDCPIERDVLVKWIESLNNPLYKEILRVIKEPTPKE